VKVNRSTQCSESTATQINQFANTSRDRIPPNRLNGFPVRRC
jgi:hypothetical protein